MEDADWNSYRQKLCYLMHRTDICGRALACLCIALYTVISIQKEKGFQSTLRDKSCTLKPWH